MSYQRGTLLLFAVLAVGLIASCGDSSEDSGAAATLDSAADAAKETGEAVADAASDAVAEVGEVVEDATQASGDIEERIAKTEAELQKIADELKELSATDLMGDKAKDLKSRQEKLTEELEALKEKL